MTIDTRNEWKASDVKLPILVQKWIWNVLLQNHGPIILTTVLNHFQNTFVLGFNHDSCSSVWIFTWFYYPNVFRRDSLLFCYRLVNCWLVFIEIGFELDKLLVFKTWFNMERKRQSFKYICVLATEVVVVFHIEEQSFLVVQMMVAFKFVVYLLNVMLNLNDQIWKQLWRSILLFLWRDWR